MNIKVKFFEENFTNAIGAGVYEIYLQTIDNEELIYVGESVFVLVRCATHLYEIAKGKGYFGFDKEQLENENITLIFKLMISESDKSKRRKIEQETIDNRKPSMQSGIRDRVKSIEDMINEITRILNK